MHNDVHDLVIEATVHVCESYGPLLATAHLQAGTSADPEILHGGWLPICYYTELWRVAASEGGVDSHPIHPPGSAPGFIYTAVLLCMQDAARWSCIACVHSVAAPAIHGVYRWRYLEHFLCPAHMVLL